MSRRRDLPSPLDESRSDLEVVPGNADPRSSHDVIYESVMRGGGEPFGAPYEVGVSSLTEKIVRFFRQRSFFGFEVFEGARPKRKRNRFTRYGSSRYFGSYDLEAAKRAAQRRLSTGESGGKKKPRGR